jgi:hypothetical protein
VDSPGVKGKLDVARRGIGIEVAILASSADRVHQQMARTESELSCL